METNSESLRTPEELSELLLLAKLNELDLSNVTQVLYSEKSNDYSNLKLIELDKNLMKAIEVGDSLSFRGEKDESVVLCTKNQTYEVREAETSNSLLLVPDLNFHSELSSSKPENKSIKEQKVNGIFHSYLEVRQCKPKFSKLPVILGSTAFNGVEYEKLVDQTKLYDWNKLQSHIQASDEELRKALSEYLVVNINGHYRMVSFEYEARALTDMLEFVDDSSMKSDEIDKEASIDALHELIPEAVFNALFEKYAEPSGKFKDSGETLYRYIEEKVCKLLAKVLITASPVTEYSGFMDAWRIGTPEGMTSQEKYLYGIAIVKWNSEKNRKEVVSFPESNLPDNIEKRFEELFKVKDKWSIEEITPYVVNLTTEKLNVNALLTKYARLSTKNGVRFYSSKHGK